MPYKEGDIVTYIGSDDEWNHECCKGAEYRIDKVYPPVRGIYYYDIVTTVENYSVLEHDFYQEIWSVPHYQLVLKEEPLKTRA